MIATLLRAVRDSRGMSPVVGVLVILALVVLLTAVLAALGVDPGSSAAAGGGCP